MTSDVSSYVYPAWNFGDQYNVEGGGADLVRCNTRTLLQDMSPAQHRPPPPESLHKISSS